MGNKIRYNFLVFLIVGLLLPTTFISAEKKDEGAIPTESTTATADLQTLIQQLQNQVKELQEQIIKLKSEIQEIKEELRLTKNLRKGLSDDEVKELQKFLSQFREIYPEGLITGYFGSLTEKAIKKFQEKYDIPATGMVGPLTRDKINEFLAEEAKEEKVTICHIPLGNLAAKHTLIIGKLALEAHLAHGDAVGVCEAQPTVATPVPESVPAKPAAVPVITGTITPVSASSIIQLVTLGDYAYGVTTNGSVLCWSSGVTDVVGGMTTKLPGSETPVLCTLKDIAKIAPGSSHSCAVKTDGSAICWGGNQYGQLGNGTYSDNLETSPVSVSGLGPGTTADIVVGGAHTCALKTDGSVICWGANGTASGGGQLGDGTNEPVRFTPVQVIGLSPGTTAAIFPDRIQKGGACALKTNGVIVCWGQSSVIGYSKHSTPIPAPDLIPGTIKYLSILRKGFCALKTDDSVICSGRNLEGQLGGEVKIGNSTFTQVSGLTKNTTAEITSGVYYTCALKKDDSVICWGENDRGQLGDGTIFFKYAPVSVLGLGVGTTATISASGDFSGITCALKKDGFVACWPGGKIGEDGKPTNRTPTLVPLIKQ